MAFAQKLIAWQRRHGRHDLPWQGTTDPYRIWLSEVMLQQTQVSTVIPYYQRFLRKYPTVRALASASEEEVSEQDAGERAVGLDMGIDDVGQRGEVLLREHRGWMKVEDGARTVEAMIQHARLSH